MFTFGGFAFFRHSLYMLRMIGRFILKSLGFLGLSKTVEVSAEAMASVMRKLSPADSGVDHLLWQCAKCLEITADSSKCDHCGFLEVNPILIKGIKQ